MSTTPYLSQSTFESLLPSIVAILQATQPHPLSTLNTQRQEIAKAVSAQVAPCTSIDNRKTMALRSQVSTARDLIDALPGGEMLLEHQQEVIAMLIEMRNERR
ncbi:hypothetical protein CTheo_1062 [Ceratobasidium theobromae]|uniref:Mediator of RNA polymerase II transcription subunit 9 n=1 Tax=Ceratobasidium theobromae TaxID=1582974 RepID=A0A5N5QVJ6_9AGAM|nr:hypothetical protein CTheo_1062 [Ceratobasidium theobromae]